ncbi:P-loop containing nucleoside triphosphate hydrolase protein [Aspergillus sclerotioniger CBS 115572]|uniref:P-loop containing nucleoside triphosphate hydrolase protein n=1 Tax=Aspergillus sclerotioniger CBS 115572 TaxID=1450535 RepID=A0A317VRD1_9EURO|nr:P-loop containing nucleoside triphosphate hydrolase protein [Aspergillus sclerotioniger CBS 115572]PWY76119.1 P-loop containing nucleoside triphosphate hydrolase protein [Aspergillus sclerotioniger CBS 115572]
MSYCSQAAWLQNTIVRKAICRVASEDEFDGDWYRTGIEACALDEDIKLLPLGDDTMLGSREVTLSGGQKQRMVVWLNGVLSSIYAKAESRVVTNLFGPTGLLRRTGSTVIMVTHAVHQLHLADQIIALDSSGRIIQKGPWEEFRKVMIKGLQSDTMTDISVVKTAVEPEQKKPLPKSVIGPTANDFADLSQRTGDLSVYKFYVNSFGWKLSLAMLATVIMVAITTYFPHVWLQLYTAGAVRHVSLFCSVYSVVALSARIVFIHLIPKSGGSLHKTLLQTVIRAPQSYFDKTDSGTILNLFSQDMTLVDSALPISMIITLQGLANGLAQIGLIASGSSYMALTIPVLLCLLNLLQNMRLLDLEAKSPLYTHFMETLEGLVTIRAFGWQQEFNEISNALLNNSQRPYYLLYCIQRWLNLELRLLIGSLAIIMVTLAVTLRGSTSGGQIGIALNGMLGFNATLEMLFMFWTSLETSLGAIARLKNTAQYTQTEAEGDQYPRAEWPESGEVVFRGVCASYGPDAPALTDVTLTVPPGMKVGICGRTGSGKSSLLSTLLCILDLDAGEILIDGYNIHQLPRNTVRSRMISITQEAFFLSASVRENADLSQSSTDDVIRSALIQTGLWTTINNKGGLDADMKNMSLSQGQQQLFCLARVIIKKNKSRILVLDKATSGMDNETDKLMQEVLGTEFTDHMVITVAHRLDAILDSDLIAVLDQGRVVEYGPPSQLLSRQSLFQELCNQ